MFEVGDLVRIKVDKNSDNWIVVNYGGHLLKVIGVDNTYGQKLDLISATGVIFTNPHGGDNDYEVINYWPIKYVEKI